LAIPQIEFLVVLWTGELVGAIDVVFGIAIGREDMASADGVDGQRMGFFPIGTQGAAEDGRRIELMATEFTHQAGTCPIEQPPTDKFLHGRDSSVADGFFHIAESGSVYFVGHPGPLLGDFALELFDFRWAFGLFQFLDIFIQVGLDAIDFGIWISSDHRWLPGVVSG